MRPKLLVGQFGAYTVSLLLVALAGTAHTLFFAR